MALRNLLYAAAAGTTLISASPIAAPHQRRADRDTNYQRAADSAVILNGWYDQGTGLWRDAGWWNSANLLTALGDLDYAGDQHPFDIRAVFENTFTQAQKSFAMSVSKTLIEGGNGLFKETHSFVLPEGKAPLTERGFDRFLNDYYDDEGWWALARKSTTDY